MKVVEAKDLFADGGELLDGSPEMFSEFLTLEISAGTRVCLGDPAFVYGMQRFGVMFLLSEVVGADIFGNPIHPRIEG